MRFAEPVDVLELKEQHRAMWAAGDFARIAELTVAVSTDVVERLRLGPGMDVLDVATGTGNAALSAAALGARVTALDLAPELLEKGPARRTRRLPASSPSSLRTFRRPTSTPCRRGRGASRPT